MNRYLFYTFLLFIILSACKKDDQEAIVSSELQEYFERFQMAGIERGVNVDFTETAISGRVANLFDSNVNGWCSFNEDKPDEIVIDDSFWSEASEFEKEFIIMHELGHCYLNRMHNDGKDGAGICESIMHSSTDTCIFPYDEETREAYLDELFQ